jgi:Replication-relaxation
MNGQRLGSRGLDGLRDEMSERDLAVVRQVAELKLMSTRQIETLHFSTEQHATALTGARVCRRVLERLVRERLLVRLVRRVGGVRAGSASFVYGLGPVGQRVLSLEGPRRRYREPTSTFVLHTLTIGDVVVALTLATRRGELELVEMQAEPICWRPLDHHGNQVLRPDLFVSLAVGEYEYRSFVEVDLDTESLPRLVAKCQTYEAYFRGGAEQQTHGIFPRVVWIMPSDERTRRLRAAIRATRSLTRELFVVTTEEHALNTLTATDDDDARRGTS